MSRVCEGRIRARLTGRPGPGRGSVPVSSESRHWHESDGAVTQSRREARRVRRRVRQAQTRRARRVTRTPSQPGGIGRGHAGRGGRGSLGWQHRHAAAPCIESESCHSLSEAPSRRGSCQWPRESCRDRGPASLSGLVRQHVHPTQSDSDRTVTSVRLGGSDDPDLAENDSPAGPESGRNGVACPARRTWGGSRPPWRTVA